MLIDSVFLVSVLFVSFYFDIKKEDYYKKNVMQVESKFSKEYKVAEKKFLKSYNLIDKETGMYSIPIENAMKMVEKKYSGKVK